MRRGRPYRLSLARSDKRISTNHSPRATKRTCRSGAEMLGGVLSPPRTPPTVTSGEGQNILLRHRKPTITRSGYSLGSRRDQTVGNDPSLSAARRGRFSLLALLTATIRGRLSPECNDGVMNRSSYSLPRIPHVRRRVGALSTAVLFVAGALGSAGIASMQTADAATSGWYVATVPGTGADDVLLGSTCANSLQCWAVGISLGNLAGPGPSSANPLMEAWNGTTWTLVPLPLPGGEGGGLFDATCVNGSDCWAVGAVVGSGSGNPTGTLVEQWNGTSWSVVPSPTPSGPGVAGAILSSVSCTSASSCMAVGYATDSGGNNLTDVVEQWNGSSWTIIPAAATGQAFDQLISVQCLSAADCWAVGNAGPVAQMSNFLPIFPGAIGDQGLIEHWDGSAWSIVPSVSEPAPNGGYLSGLECVGRHRLLGLGRHDRRHRELVGDPHGALGRCHLDRFVGIGARLHGPGPAGWYLLRERSVVLGGRFYGIVQQRRLGRAAPEPCGVLERIVVVRAAQSHGDHP